MLNGFRFPKWATRSERRAAKPRQSSFGLSRYHRRLGVETLEVRTLLSVISSDTTWTAADLPYVGDVYVENGATLTIQSGLQVQGSGALYIDYDGSGGNLKAQGMTFNNLVYLKAGASASLSGDTFSSIVFVDAQLAASLVGNTFPTNSTVFILGGTLAGSATLPSIPNVSTYDFYNTQYIEHGGSLTIASGDTISGSSLYVDDNGSGGTLSAQGVTFNNFGVYLDAGALVSLSGDNFNFNMGGNVYVDTQLATSLVGNTFPANSTVYIWGGTLTGSATLPSIPHVSTYSFYNDQNVESGGSLTIASGNTISGGSLWVSPGYSGGTLSAQGVTFKNDDVSLWRGASVSLSGDTFLSGNVYVDIQLATCLVGSTFPANSTVCIFGGTLAGSATLPSIPHVSTYSFDGDEDIEGSLTIASGNTISGSSLWVSPGGSGGTLSAQGVTFNILVRLDAGATANLSGDQFNGVVYVDAELADSLAGSTFPANSTVYIFGGTLDGLATLPSIPHVSTYSFYNTQYIEHGGSLTIASGNTISGASLYVNDNNTGGELVAEGVTFNNQLSLGKASAGTLEFDTFNNAGYNYFDGQMLATVTDDNFAASKACAQGTGGPIILEGNYWGTTDLTVIRQTKIYDHTNDASLPVIDINSPLATAPVLDTTPPTVSSYNAPGVTTAGGTTETFTVTYADNVAVKVSTLDSSDVRVTGPNGYSQLATFVSVDNNSNGTPRTATYQIPASGGTWDSADNGTYTLTVQSGQVSDTGGNYMATTTVGSFIVNVPVAAPTVTVKSPCGGENWPLGVAYTITWSVTNTSQIDHFLVFYSLNGGTTYVNNVGTAAATSRSISWTPPITISPTALGQIRVEACNASNSVLSQAFSNGLFFFNDILFHPGDKVEAKSSSGAIVRSITGAVAGGAAGTNSLYKEKEFSQGTVVSQAPLVASLGVGGEYYFWYQVNWGDGNQIGWTADVTLGLAFGEDAKAVPVGSFNGVTAYSNGSTDNASFYPKSNIPKSKYSDGMQWQCVEYANRYSQSKYGIDLSEAGYATSYFNYGSTQGLTQFTNGEKGNVAPQAGDILCFSGGPEGYGHVAIVRSVDLVNGLVYVIQQNGVEDPRDENWPFKLTDTGGVYNVSADSLDPKLDASSSALSVQGWLRKPAAATPTLTTIVVSPSPTSLNLAATQQFTAMGLDQFGAVLSTQPTFTWATTVGTVTTSGVLTTSANVPGTGTVTATSGLASGSATVNVLPTEMVPDLTSPGKTALYVFGTAGNNKILVNPASGPGTVAGAVAVLFNGTLVGTFDPTSRICVYGYGASDYIQVSPSITLSAWLFGGSGTNYLYGGGGNDVIVGGPGTNYISGGAGRNLLIGGGGGGPNYIQGTTGDNIEISGTTSYNANEAALNAILQEWASGDSYSVRVDKITGTNGYSLSADGSQVILNSSTIQQVAACEYLYSGSGQDLFFATETGSVYDRDYVIKRKTTGLNAEMELPN
jgi:hypothetical protein